MLDEDPIHVWAWAAVAALVWIANAAQAHTIDCAGRIGIARFCAPRLRCIKPGLVNVAAFCRQCSHG